MSQDIFQKKIDKTYEKYRDAVGIADDINVFGTESTHDDKVHEVMERKQESRYQTKF